ncbi:MAG: hypothetical protein ABNH53_01100 [Henriciella sp.]|jgi:hypothetical protein
MKTAISSVLFALATLTATSACEQQADAPWSSEVEGSVFEVRVAYENESAGGESSGNSRGHNTLIERIIKVDPTEIVAEYERIPSPRRYVGEQPNLIDWDYPATISVLDSDELTLQNLEEIEARNTEWRQAAGIPDEACGLWYFTWNAFKIECDPNSVIQGLEAFILYNNEILDGQKIEEPGALEAGILTTVSTDPLILQAEFELDSEIIREERAQEDIIFSQIMQGETLTLENALQVRATEQISGTLKTVWEMDELGRVWKRTRNSNITIEFETGETETLTQKQTTTRTLQAK